MNKNPTAHRTKRLQQAITGKLEALLVEATRSGVAIVTNPAGRELFVVPAEAVDDKGNVSLQGLHGYRVELHGRMASDAPALPGVPPTPIEGT